MKPTTTLRALAIGLCICSTGLSGSLSAQSLASIDPEPVNDIQEQLNIHEPSELPVIQLSGESRFENGKARIELDPLAAKHIPDYDYNYQIMVMPEGDTPAMFISNKSMDGFTVTQLGPKTDDSGFSWTLIATPKPTEGGPTITKAIHTHPVPAPRIVRNFEQIN